MNHGDVGRRGKNGPKSSRDKKRKGRTVVGRGKENLLRDFGSE